MAEFYAVQQQLKSIMKSMMIQGGFRFMSAGRGLGGGGGIVVPHMSAGLGAPALLYSWVVRHAWSGHQWGFRPTRIGKRNNAGAV